MIVNETILGFLRYLEKFIAIKCYLVLLYQIAFGNFHQTPIYIVPKYYIAKFSEWTLPHPAYMPLYSTLHPPCLDFYENHLQIPIFIPKKSKIQIYF